MGDILELVDGFRLDASHYLPLPVLAGSLVSAIAEVAARYPTAYNGTDLREVLVARVAVELGCSWPDVAMVEDLTTGLNEAYTPWAPLRFDGLALEYWSLLDDLSSQGWRWDAVGKFFTEDYRARSSEIPF